MVQTIEHMHTDKKKITPLLPSSAGNENRCDGKWKKIEYLTCIL